MKITKLFIALFVLALSLSTFTFAGNPDAPKDEPTFKLSDLSDEFQEYEGNDSLDFVTGKISYVEIDEEKYDLVFKQAAFINAKITQLKNGLDIIDLDPAKYINDVKTLAGGAGNLFSGITSVGSIEDLKALKTSFETLKGQAGNISREARFTVKMISFAVEIIPLIPEEVSFLTTSISNLNPQDDFSGIMSIGTLGDAVDGITKTSGYLTDAAADVPVVIEKVGSIVNKLK